MIDLLKLASNKKIIKWCNILKITQSIFFFFYEFQLFLMITFCHQIKILISF